MEKIEFKTELGEGVAVDHCHLDLVHGLIRSRKPTNVLEIGVGSGRTTTTIINACNQNKQEYALTLVDNWLDWGGMYPESIREFTKAVPQVKVVQSSERDFIFDGTHGQRYDFIFSDGDHWNTDKWFEYVYNRVLADNGVLIYHDVSLPGRMPAGELSFPNLSNILMACKHLGISHMHFDQCSEPGERCYRGLLVIFKGQLPKVVPVGSSLSVYA